MNKTKFKIILFSLFLLLTTNIIKSSDTNIYKSIAKENLKSLTDIDLDEENDDLSSLINDEAYFYEILQKTLAQQLNPAPPEKRKLVFNLVSKLEAEKEKQVLDETTWQDLEILCGPKSNPEIYLASKIDRTITEIGKICLYKKIVQPKANPQQLIEQQNIVKELINNKALFELLDKDLKDLAMPENALLSFWQDDLFKSILNQQSMILPLPKKIKDKMLKNEVTLELLNRLQFFNDIFSNTFAAMGIGTLSLLGILLILEQSGTINQNALTNALKQKLNYFNSTFGVSAAGSLGLFFVICKFLESKNFNTKGFEGGINITGSALESIWIPHKFYDLKAWLVLYESMEEKLIHVSTFTKNLIKMTLELQKHQETKHLTPLIQSLINSLKNLYTKSNDTKHLLESLNTETFEGKPASFLTRWGRVEVVYKLMCELKDEFKQILLAIGEIDSYMSIAKLYKEFENKPVKFCFPEYDFSTKNPSIDIENFWNPFIDPEKVIPNSLTLGEKYSTPQNIIISGPNAAGKSTITKGLIMSIILAQSIGITPASKLTFTPFDKIATYLNITDDIAAGNSHFKAGVERARELNDISENLKENEKSLMAVDELFNGTTYKEGQAAAYSFIKHLGLNSKNICITATHFPNVTNLEKETGMFTNYKVSVIENGKLQYPYKLEKGPSHQIITFQILKEEGFGDEFLAEAETQLLN